MRRPKLLLGLFAFLLLNFIGTGQARPVMPLPSGNQQESRTAFPWYAIVIAAVSLPILIFLIYKCFHPRTIFKQCIKSQGGESG